MIEKKSGKAAKIIGTVLVLAGAALCALFVVKHLNNDAEDDGPNTNIRGSPVTLADMENKRYITDCKYTEVFDYPEVYDTAFNKSEDEYVRNKDLPEADKKPIVTTAEEFFNSLLNTGYRNIQADPQKYAASIKAHAAPSVIMEGIYPLDNNSAYTVEEIAETLGDYLVKNQVEQEDVFVTNESLVFRDLGSYWVRGVLKNIIHYSDDTGITEEEEHIMCVDVEVCEDDLSDTGYAVQRLWVVGDVFSPPEPKG